MKISRIEAYYLPPTVSHRITPLLYADVRILRFLHRRCGAAPTACHLNRVAERYLTYLNSPLLYWLNDIFDTRVCVHVCLPT